MTKKATKDNVVSIKKNVPLPVAASKPMLLIEGKSKIDTKITSIQARGKRLSRDIHVVAVSCLNHIDKHGDITLLSRLLDVLPNGWRKNAVKAWAVDHGKVSWVLADPEKKTPAGFKFNGNKQTMLKEAMEKSPEEYKPEPDYRPMDLTAAFYAIIEKAKSRLNEDGTQKNPADKIPADLLKRIEERLPVVAE